MDESLNRLKEMVDLNVKLRDHLMETIREMSNILIHTWKVYAQHLPGCLSLEGGPCSCGFEEFMRLCVNKLDELQIGGNENGNV